MVNGNCTDSDFEQLSSVWNKYIIIPTYMCTQGMWFYLMWNTISE